MHVKYLVRPPKLAEKLYTKMLTVVDLITIVCKWINITFVFVHWSLMMELLPIIQGLGSKQVSILSLYQICCTIPYQRQICTEETEYFVNEILEKIFVTLHLKQKPS